MEFSDFKFSRSLFFWSLYWLEWLHVWVIYKSLLKFNLSNESSPKSHSNGTICVITEDSSFPYKWNLIKCVTTQMKALREYVLMVLFLFLLKRVHFLTNETYLKVWPLKWKFSGSTIILMVLFLFLLKRDQFLANETYRCDPSNGSSRGVLFQW